MGKINGRQYHMNENKTQLYVNLQNLQNEIEYKIKMASTYNLTAWIRREISAILQEAKETELGI